MPTEKELQAKHKGRHDTLSTSYYAGDSGLTKEDFDQQHGQIWDDMEAELIAEGFRVAPEPAIDWKALYAAAPDSEKQKIMARRLGLE